MFAQVHSGAVSGVDAHPVVVEVDLANGIPAYVVVGLPDAAIHEAKDRVRAAMRNAGYEFPVQRATVNLAPADMRKEGPLYDLPIALGFLVASGQLQAPALADAVVVGELALDGSVRPVRGVLPIALAARQAGRTLALVPAANAAEAALVEGLAVHPVESLAHAAAILAAPGRHDPVSSRGAGLAQAEQADAPDLAEVRGQAHAKRALEVAAAGGHNLVLVGPPGSGKTMLARRLPGILPPLTYDEALDVTRLYSVAGYLGPQGGLVSQRPFRAPHHSVSNAGLIGGGSVRPRPGEVSLAHHGVLFLDEVAEFRRDILEMLRQPLEEGHVTIARASGTVTFPADITLVAALNPCPCGFRGDWALTCTCTPGQAARYWGRLSGPLLDRIDLQVQVARLGEDELLSVAPAEPSRVIRARVLAAREVQAQRFAGERGVFRNAHMRTRQLRQHCALDAAGEALMRDAIAKLGISARSFDRILKVARSIADLAGSDDLQASHVGEAIGFRSLEREAVG